MQLDLQAALSRTLAGHYTVVREIGRGGMAVVYEARDLIAERDVAIKLLYPDLARALGGERFLREIRILQQLSHPNILSLLDSGTIELLPGLHLPWYAMPLARDETLRARLAREGALPLATALGYTRDLCAALRHAHEQGVIHRDIKPENILLVDGHAMLADFGIARAITVAGGDTLSTTGIVVGTPAYMSPEQSTGAPQLDGRSDLYSLGVVLYEMLAGHPPFTGSTPQAVSARHQFEAPPPIAVVRPGLPEGVTAVLERALAKLAPDRFQQAASLDAAVAELPQHIASPRHIRWRRTLVFLIATLSVVSLLGLLGLRTIRADVRSPAIAVIPFAASGVTSAALCGTECSTLVDDALSEWVDFPKIDQVLVRNSVMISGPPSILDQAARVARSLGAGRFIWGQVYPVGDSLRIRLLLIQLQRFRSRLINEDAVTIPLRVSAAVDDSVTSQLVFSSFRSATRRLIAMGSAMDLAADEALHVADLRAVRMKLQGDSALGTWDVRSAEDLYQAALRFDPGYAQAHLMLGLIGSWKRAPVTSWGPHANAAALGRAYLSRRQSLIAEGLSALATGRHLDACRRFNRAVAADSSDFSAWIGLGDCQLDDKVVEPANRSRSGWTFRGSYSQALFAFRKALALVPTSHHAFSGVAVRGLTDRFYVEPNRLRVGYAKDDTTMRFAAFPVFAADTFGFIPRPFGQLVMNKWPEEHDPLAVARLQRSLLELTRQWILTQPASADAWNTHATVLELNGMLSFGIDTAQSAGLAYRKAREMATDPVLRLEIGSSLTRVSVKLNRQQEASALADSLLGQANPVYPEEFERLAGLAAFRSATLDAARFIRASAPLSEFSASDGAVPGIPNAVKADALALLVFAVSGGPLDSIRSLHASILSATGFSSPTASQEREREALLMRPALFGFPLLGPPTFSVPLLEVQAAILAGNTALAKAKLDEIRLLRGGWRAGARGPEGALLEARLLLQLKDTVEATRVLTEMYDNLSTLGQDILIDIPQAGSLGQGLRLLDSLAAQHTTPRPAS